MKLTSKMLAGLLVLGTVTGSPEAFAGPGHGGKADSVPRINVPAQKKALPSMKASELVAKVNGGGRTALEELRKGVRLTELSKLAANPIDAAAVVLKALSGALDGDITGVTVRFKKEHLLVRIGRGANAKPAASPASPATEPPAAEDDEE